MFFIDGKMDIYSSGKIMIYVIDIINNMLCILNYGVKRNEK